MPKQYKPKNDWHSHHTGMQKKESNYVPRFRSAQQHDGQVLVMCTTYLEV
jgi:hypothetical protein